MLRCENSRRNYGDAFAVNPSRHHFLSKIVFIKGRRWDFFLFSLKNYLEAIVNV